MGKAPETHFRPREGNEGNQTGPAEAGRERKANNNDDLMQCQMKYTGVVRNHLSISDLFSRVCSRWERHNACAAAVAALIKSTHPHASAALVKALLYAEADGTACTDPYDIDGDGKVDAVCEGPRNYNGFYGWGTVDALAAVTK